MNIIGEANANEPRLAPTIVLPWPPTGNSNVRHARGRHYLTPEHKAFRAEVLARTIERKLRSFHGKLCIKLHFWAPDARRRDIHDNTVKPVCDALQNAGVFQDDFDIDQLHVFRMPVDRKNPRVEVFIGRVA